MLPAAGEEVLADSSEVQETTLMATGDVMLGRSVNTRTAASGDQLYPFRWTQALLAGADLTLINLENPLVDPCPSTDTGMRFCAPEAAADTLALAGVDVANLANNHIRNYGETGYQSTITALGQRGIAVSDAQQLARVERNGTVFGFLGFDLVTTRWSPDRLADKISLADSQVDVLVVSVHRGAEYAADATEGEKELLRLAVDAGADVVIGHHPHVVQPVEVYRGVPIAYSLGNFIFDQMWSQTTREGVVGIFVFSGKKLASYQFIPVLIEDLGQPRPVGDPSHAAAILSRLRLQTSAAL